MERILYYAPGGGLGHLTRARAVIHTLGLSDVLLLTASPFANDKRVIGESKVLFIPKHFENDIAAYQFWLAELFAKYSFEKIIVDTFPAGIVGEFNDFNFPHTAQLLHVARALRLEEYGQYISAAPGYDISFVVETLPDAQTDFLKRHSGKVIKLYLIDPPPQEAILIPDNTWLVVHSESTAETSRLLAMASLDAQEEQQRPRIIVVSPAVPQIECEYLNYYPASDLFSQAQRIYTACGFNCMRQTEFFKQKHRYLPFARLFDDQAARAQQRKELTHGE
jgi:predicted glycosyltransferase